MEPTEEFGQLRLGFVDPMQWRYEVIRPLVLFGDRTATQRAHETQTHPDTVRVLTRRFRQRGMPGLLPSGGHKGRQQRAPRISTAVRQEVDRLQALYPGFHYRELARILSYKFETRSNDKTAKHLWTRSEVSPQGQRPRWTYHTQPDRAQARLQVITLYAQGWETRSISRFLQVSRPTIDAWIARWETDHVAGLLDKSRAPKVPARKVWLPLRLRVYHLQKRHPDAGGFRIWSLLATPEISGRTVERIMALNRQLYADIPHGRPAGAKPLPQPQPYKAVAPHQYWFIDGRKMDFAIEGVKWWSLIILDGYSRTMLAGAVAPTEASWVALMVLSTACLRYGVPQFFISDSGGAFTSNEFAAVCTRLQIEHKPMESTKGESYLNWMETHCNIQRRLYDYEFSLSATPLEFEQAPQALLEIYNTTAHQGLLKEQFQPPIPLEVLGEAKGRLYTADELARQFSQALFPRTTNQYGCVTIHSYHFYVEQGVPKTQVLLWVYGEQLRAVLDNVVLADYYCRYDWHERKGRDIHDGVFYSTRFASPQIALLPLNPQESLVVYRPQALRRPPRRPFPAQQLWLFELVHTA